MVLTFESVNETLNYSISNITLPILLSRITYSRDGENFLIHQWNSCWVIISFVFMTSLTEKALIIWRSSLLERQGLKEYRRRILIRRDIESNHREG